MLKTTFLGDNPLTRPTMILIGTLSNVFNHQIFNFTILSGLGFSDLGFLPQFGNIASVFFPTFMTLNCLFDAQHVEITSQAELQTFLNDVISDRSFLVYHYSG